MAKRKMQLTCTNESSAHRARRYLIDHGSEVSLIVGTPEGLYSFDTWIESESFSDTGTSLTRFNPPIPL